MSRLANSRLRFQNTTVACIIQVVISNLSAFFSKFWLLNIVPYVSGSRKLLVLSRTFGLGDCDIIMTSSEPQKLVFMPWTQSKVMKTPVIDMFSWDSSNLIQLSSCNSNTLGVWEFVRIGWFSNYRIFGYISEI